MRLLAGMCCAAEYAGQGDKLLTPDFIAKYPYEAEVMKEAAGMMDAVPCTELAINGLWGMVERSQGFPVKAELVRDMAAKLIEIRSAHARWDEPF